MAGLLEVTGLERQYRSSDGGFRLRIPHLTLKSGETLVIMGESGSGKSTLLDMLALLAPPTVCDRFVLHADGVKIDVGEAWRQGQRGQLAGWRARYMGYVLQTGGLLPYLTVRDNIALSRRLLGLTGNGPVPALAAASGITEIMDRLPEQLSIGQRQRVAVVRALAHQPRLVLADEPTAALDPARALALAKLLATVVAETGTALILVCHDLAVADQIGGRRLWCQSLTESGQPGSVVTSGHPS
jgi:putative ABC transport system ATP-binding protein